MTAETNVRSPLDELLEALQHDTADITSLVNNLPPEAAAAAIPALGQALTNQQNDISVRQRAVLALRAIGRTETVPFLGRALTEDTNLIIRRIAMAALEQIDLLDGVPYFAEALTDSDENLRESAAYALGTAVIDAVSNLDVDDAILHQQSENLINAIGREPLSAILNTDERPEARQAAATALGYLGDPDAINTLCAALQQEAETPGVLWSVISALRKIGTVAAVPCLGNALTADASALVRQQAAGALEQIGDPAAIPFLANAMVDDGDSNVREAAASALAQFPTWQVKTDAVLDILRQSRQERATVNSIRIVRAIKPHDSELVRDKNLLTDYLIGKAIPLSNDARMTAIMAKLIIDSTDGILTVAGERVNEYKQRNNITEAALQNLRVEIGGATALNPIIDQLKEDLEIYFQKPIKELNDETRAMWQSTISRAHTGFMSVAIMSYIVFALGVIIVAVSFIYFLQGDLDQVALFGSGVSFVVGIGLMLNTIYRGPLRNIRQAVTDVGVANAAFIGYIHRVQQISHTFSFLYLQQQISPEELQKLGHLIEDAMGDTIRLLNTGDLPEDPAQLTDSLNSAVAEITRPNTNNSNQPLG